MPVLKLLLSCCCWVLLSTWTLAADDADTFASVVRPTPHLSPAEEQESFTLPAGFEIQLFAAEPQIAKPLNMAFDDRGRLWITNTVEYPYAAPDDRPGRDSIRILEDTNHDGRADKITTFADGLNIPMGLLPYRDGVIVFSIPNIWHLRDTNGDGKADVRTKLYGPFGVDRDTHGLNNAFRRNYDGWIYACHGFNNHTSVQGTDGHVVKMHSGNTYRFRVDGSRIEQFTHGQVNPFGMAFDSRGDIFTADCHSKPIYQLLRDGYYPSFGRPHNGLGYVPPMMEHLHGSTAISGIAVYEDDRFPEALRGTVFSGNVMTCRINHNSLVKHGSTYMAKEEDDFLKSSDPWFRPVDIQLSPDGSLFVSDFYNRIIGHYEVPLEHEGRDRTSGRIWRIVKTGKAKPRQIDLTTLPSAKLLQTLASPNQTQRFLAINRLVDYANDQTAEEVRQFFNQSNSPNGRSCAIWVLDRLGQLEDETLAASANDPSSTLRTHAMKILAERGEWTPKQRAMVLHGLQDDDAFVRRAAADGLSLHPRSDQVAILVKMLREVDTDDTHLRYVFQQALLNNLQSKQGFAVLADMKLSDSDRDRIAEVLLASPTAESASFLLPYVAKQTSHKEQLSTFLQHISRYLPAGEIPKLVTLVRTKVAKNIDTQSELLLAIVNGQRQQGAPLADAVRQWAVHLASESLDSVGLSGLGWVHQPDKDGNGAVPWGIRPLLSTDGRRDPLFIDSRTGGEQATGAYRSPLFSIPSQFSFYLAGHRGAPPKEPHELTRVELHDANTDKILARAFPPRHDTAQKIEWQLAEVAGRQGYLKIVDGDSARGFAWLAVGRFVPSVVKLPTADPALMSKRLEAAAQLATELHLVSLKPQLAKVLRNVASGSTDAQTVAKAIASLAKDSRLYALIPGLAANETSSELRRQIVEALASNDLRTVASVLSAVAKAVPSAVQQQMAEQLIRDRQGAAQLLRLVEAGQFSPRVLLHPVVAQALPQLLSDEQQTEVQSLTADLPALPEELQAAIATRLQGYPKATPSLERGLAAFEKHCAVCHRIGKTGALVGPQLDGIGDRGLQRLLEDMLDPNRNVDAAFRTSTIVMDSGKVLTGLFRRKEGAILVFAGSDGKEFNVAEEEIEERIESPVSLMPSGFTDAINEETCYDLLAYLLAERGK